MTSKEKQGKARACTFFKNKGGCSHGDKCWFKHEKPTASDAQTHAAKSSGGKPEKKDKKGKKR